MLYDALQKGPLKIPGYHDPDSIRIFSLLFRPDTWAANTVYGKRSEDDYDVVIPAVFTGLYYKVKNPGKSGATEPDFVMVDGEETEDGVLGLVWEAVNYNLMPVAETIADFDVTATDSIPISAVSHDDISGIWTIGALPDGLSTFQVTIHYTKSNGEEDDRTLEFKVAEH